MVKDSHHSKAHFACPICDEDSYQDDLLTHNFLAGGGGEVDSGMAPQIQGNQPGEEFLWHHLEAESTQTEK